MEIVIDHHVENNRFNLVFAKTFLKTMLDQPSFAILIHSLAQFPGEMK